MLQPQKDKLHRPLLVDEHETSTEMIYEGNQKCSQSKYFTFRNLVVTVCSSRFNIKKLALRSNTYI